MYYFGWSVYKEMFNLERFYLAHLLFHINYISGENFISL